MTLGALLSLATGLIENRGEIGIPEIRQYGHPLVWRVTQTFQATEYRLASLALDAAFWIIISLLSLALLQKVALPKLSGVLRYEKLLFPLVLFIPLGLVMDLAHELGHAIWGVASGGRLTYMKIAYLEIYPRLALTPSFTLGLVDVQGLAGSAYGLFLLGGSMSTSAVSWSLALILSRMKLGSKTRIGLSILGVFGLLDLPLYVLLPRIGLRHWIFLGGCGPEPLIGARIVGIPDPAFYLMVLLSTLGLVLLYFKPLRMNAKKRIGIVFNVA